MQPLVVDRIRLERMNDARRTHPLRETKRKDADIRPRIETGPPSRD
jgi:RNase adaptor protein for sRNA GlmZ degradation